MVAPQKGVTAALVPVVLTVKGSAQQMNLGRVGREYWVTTDRERAEDYASEFVNAFRRLDIDFADISIKDPCEDCKISTSDHVIKVGVISVDEAADFAGKANRAMDQLAQYRQLYGPLQEPATEDPAT
ncbi:hypothetical protein ACFWJW_00810 [Streptomyces sp. NPDC127097]|uniref:hypothetical protein n=1 Tax=Streptomyces sp. NPDC127097 TaxID=3347136 RepID=UPI0036670AC5